MSKELSGAEPDTTNNRMELMAAIRLPARRSREASSSKVRLVTDSTYVKRRRDQMDSWLEEAMAGKPPRRNR
jgi:ribonuclease HI